MNPEPTNAIGLYIKSLSAAIADTGLETWMLGGMASTVIAMSYFAISYHILRGVGRGRQWSANPLAVATGLIFFSCALGHGLHALHMGLPWVGLDLDTGLATRGAFSEWHTWGWEAVTAGVGVYYWRMRHRFPALVRGDALFEDMRVRRRNALEIHDDVVQSLARAKLALELGRNDEGYEALAEGLANSKRIITSYLGATEGSKIYPGDFVRETTGDSP